MGVLTTNMRIVRSDNSHFTSDFKSGNYYIHGKLNTSHRYATAMIQYLAIIAETYFEIVFF